MITIEIKRKTKVTTPIKKNVVTKETPTDKTDEYRRVIFAREFAVVDGEEVTEKEATLLLQHIENESEFDLVKVIQAVNQIDAGVNRMAR